MVEFQREYLVRLPLPLAQLYSRAHNAPAARARHDNTFYLFEALIKLAACPHVMAYLHEVEHGAPRVEKLDRLLAQLALPSLGQWVAILRELAKHSGKRPDAASHPLGHVWNQLNQKRKDLPAILDLFRRIKSGPDAKPSGDQSCSLLQLIDALVLYRNTVFGHGAARFDSFYEREMGPLLFPAASELLAEGVFDLLGPQGSRLVYVGELRSKEENCVEVELSELVGLQSERMTALELSADEADQLSPNCVAILWPGHKVPLRVDPLLVFHGGELTDEVLFLNRDRNGRQVEYLSYTTGKTERDKSMAPAMAKLLSRIAGREVSEEELKQLEQQSLAETPSVDALFEQKTSPRQTLGDYEILAQIGRGGMGVVYMARQMSLGRLVALKTLPADLAGDEVTLARFRREMKALSRCEHPNIVKVLNSGTLPDGQVFYAMELIPGADLEMVWRELSSEQYQGEASKLGGTTWSEAVLSASRKQREQVARRATGMSTVTGDETESHDALKPVRLEDEVETDDVPLEPLPYPPLPELPDVQSDPGGYARHVVRLIRDAAFALQTVHDEQIIHRDLKPANLMLSPDGSRVVLMDFGLAKGEQLTTTAGRGGGFLGTLRYAAPEQLASAKIKIGPQADIRALGATLWELLTRKRLFGEAEDENQLASSVLTRDVPRLRTVDSSIDRDLEAVVAKATEREASLRYQTATEFAEDLECWERGETVKARRYTLVNRATRQLRRHRKSVAAAALLLFAVSLAGLWYWDGYQRTHVEYFARATTRHGEPQGVRRLTLDEVRHRNASLKLYRRGRYGHVFEMEEINGSGGPGKTSLWTAFLATTASTEGSRDDYRFKFERDAQGKVRREIIYDVAGRVAYAFNHNESFTGGHYVDDKGYPLVRSGSGAAYLEYKLSAEGYYDLAHFRDAYGQPQRDKYGRYGYRLERDPEDERGLPIKWTILDYDGNPKRDKYGYVSIGYLYDDDGNTIEYRYLDEQDRLTLYDNGYAVMRKQYDQYGNQIEETYYGLDDRPTLQKKGYARVTVKYDDRGNRIEWAYWGLNNEPVLSIDGYAMKTAKHDQRGNQIENAKYGVDGNPTFSNYGVWKLRNKYDEQNNLIEESYIGIDGKPVPHTNGMALFKNKFDASGNKIEQAYFGVDGEPVLHLDGNAKWTARYNKDGKETEKAYFDTNGKPTLYRNSYARTTFKRDPRGNAIEQSYWGVDGKPTLNKNDYARAVYKYDAAGNLTEGQHFGLDNRPVTASNVASKLAAEYDHRGNIVKVAYFDTNGQPTLSNYGAAHHTYKYDQRDNKIEVAYYGVDGEFIENTELFAVRRMKYDDRGNQIEQQYLGADGHPTAITNGYSRVVFEYDSLGNRTSSEYFDAYGNPAPHKTENARWVARFDDRGNKTRVEHFGVDGKPARHKDGYIKWVAKYDLRGSLIEKTFSGYDGRYNFSQMKNKYDERGNFISRSNFDSDGNAVLHKDGYYGWKSEYDAWGNEIERVYIGLNSEPRRVNSGIAGWKATYNGRGKPEEKVYLDIEGKITAHSDGESKVVRKYDATGNEVQTSYLDADDNLVERKSVGYAKVERRFDGRGNKTEVAFFGADGKSKAEENNNARWTAEYDARGNQVAKAFFDVNGAPARNTSNGYSQWKAEYDERDRIREKKYVGYDRESKRYTQQVLKYNEQGKVIETVYLDDIGRLAEDKDGHARLVNDYDADGNWISQSYFDADNKPGQNSDGAHRWTAEYDDLGNQVIKEFWGEGMQPVRIGLGYKKWTAKYAVSEGMTEKTYFGFDVSKNGFAQRRVRYDANGNTIEVALFDQDGRPAEDKDGHARWTSLYDSDGNQLSLAFFNADDEPANHADGYHRWSAKYDGEPHAVEKNFFDGDGQPVRTKQGHTRWTAKYDERGKLSEQAFFGFDGKKGYSQHLLIFDGDENNIAMAFFDETGQPAACNDGYAKVTAEYDAKGNQTEAAYFGVDGKPAKHADGNHRWTADYDSRGHQTRKSYFDEVGKPARVKAGHAEVQQSFDEQGKLSEKNFAGYDGKDGYFAFRAKYDANGKPTEIAFLDENEQLAENKTDGYARAVSEYDERGNQTAMAYFDRNNAPWRTKQGHSRFRARLNNQGRPDEISYYGYDAGKLGYFQRTLKFDEKGNQLEELYLDDQGKLTNQQGGFARLVMRYDKRGNRIELTTFDDKGKLAVLENGIARFTSDFDDKGNKVAEKFFGIDGEPALNGDGYSRWSSTYDTAGRHVARVYLGLKDVPVEIQVVVTRVVPDSQGERVGAQVDDVLVRYDGDEVADANTFIDRRKQETDPKKARILEVEREGKPLKFEVFPGLLGLGIADRVISEAEKKAEP